MRSKAKGPRDTERVMTSSVGGTREPGKEVNLPRKRNRGFSGTRSSHATTRTLRCRHRDTPFPSHLAPGTRIVDLATPV